MELNELRIGNAVYKYNPAVPSMDYKIVEITGLQILKCGSRIFMVNRSHFAAFVKPIPIKEDWLREIEWEYVGDKDTGMFQYFESDWQFKKMNHRTKLQIEIQYGGSGIDLYWDYTGKLGFTVLKRNIKYRHELQNIYFDFTNKELITK